MSMLIAGMVLWSVVHLFPIFSAGARQKLIERLGHQPYRGVFALLIVTSLVLIVFGWRGSEPVAIYAAPLAPRAITQILMYLALTLFFSSRAPTDIKRLIRHPQLTGVAVFALAHLLANGDSRSLALFGSLGLWALVEIVAISRRDGPWRKPAPVGALRSAIPLLIGAIAWLALAYAHPWIAGVPVLSPG